MPSSNKLEKAEQKYNVVFDCEFAIAGWMVGGALNAWLTDPNLELHSAAAAGNVGLVH